MLLENLLEYIDIAAYHGDLTKDIKEVAYDSRQVTPGSIFVAIKGFKMDGHEYIKDAVANKAEAVIIENSQYRSDDYAWIQVENSRKALADASNAVYGYPSRKLNLIGVTGTNGKTTTANLITYILEDAGNTVGLMGTIHNRIGKEIIPVHHTTPEASDLQKMLLSFADKGAGYCVMEVSSHALDLERVRGSEYDIAVFTNLTQDHLDYHSSMEEYLRAKGKLFSGLGKNAKKDRRKFAIVNMDDNYANELLDWCRVPVITYGINKPADVMAKNVKVTAQGVTYILQYTDKEIPVSLKMTGQFNVYNTLAAIAVGLVEGIQIEKIIKSIEKVKGIPGRFEKIDAGQEFTVIVDYSHTPDSLEKCLKTAREFVEGKIITVFGCGGDRDKRKRPIMGSAAGKYSDYSIVTSDNPRSEDPKDIIEDIIPGIEKTAGSEKYCVRVDRREAIYHALDMAGNGDVIIIAGKGHEDYQIIGNKVHSFDDRQVAKEALHDLKGYGNRGL